MSLFHVIGFVEQERFKSMKLDRLLAIALVILVVPLGAYEVSPVRATDIGPIGDNYNYTSADPDCVKWNCSDMIQECDPGGTPCHDMTVDNSPGYLVSVNYACKAGWDPSSTHSGCGRD